MSGPHSRTVLLRLRAVFAATVSTGLLLGCLSAQAQTASAKTLTIVVPFTPGSGADTIARAISDALRQQLNQVVVVENRVGASGNIGTYDVARAPPDGSMLLLTANTIVLNVGLFKELNYNPLTSFVPILEVATGHMALATNPALAPKTLPEFIAFAKARPGVVDYASPGRGTPHHLAMELLKNSTGINVVHIPYSGLAKSMTDLVGGHVSAMFVGLHSIMPLANESKVRILGVGSTRRVASAPQIPTIAEQGVPDFEVEAWFGLLAPAKTPPEIVERINAAVNVALRKPEVVSALAAQGLDVVGGSPEQLRRLLVTDLEKWGKVIKEAGIAPE